MVNPILLGSASALARNVSGWAKNSFEDGVIQPYEWKKLAVSSIVSLLVYFGAYYGLGVVVDSNIEWISMGVSLVVSPLLDKFANKTLKIQ